MITNAPPRKAVWRSAAIGAALAGLYLLTRLARLTWPSLHWDEATFLYRAALIGENWERRFVGAGAGGKQPLHVWLIVLAERLIADPVLAGRLVSVTTGALAAIGLWLLARRLFSARTAWLVSGWLKNAMVALISSSSSRHSMPRAPWPMAGMERSVSRYSATLSV